MNQSVVGISIVIHVHVPVAQKSRDAERSRRPRRVLFVLFFFFDVERKILLQTFAVSLPGRVVFFQRDRMLCLVVVEQQSRAFVRDARDQKLRL